MKINENEFYLMGWESRTNNKVEMAGNGVIARMWERVFKENLKGEIPNPTSEEI